MSHNLSFDQITPLIRISICVALQDEQNLRKEFENALRAKLELPLIREAVLQTYLFAGYAAAINAFILLNEIAGTEPDQNTFWQETTQDLQDWKERGQELCQKIYGSQYEKLFHNMKQLHPDLADWMIWEGYGKVLSRPFLSPRVRELLIVAMTAALHAERQFHSHVRGALHVGATPEELRAVVEELKHFLPENILARYYDLLMQFVR